VQQAAFGRRSRLRDSGRIALRWYNVAIDVVLERTDTDAVTVSIKLPSSRSSTQSISRATTSVT
jgi:hypothetical protein